MSTTISPHSPAPWRLWHSGYANTPFVIYAGDTAPSFDRKHPLQGVEVIVEVHHDESPAHPIQAANARLISAAPALLDLAKQYLSECGECSGTGVQIGINPGGDFDSNYDRPCEECADIRAVIKLAQVQS